MVLDALDEEAVIGAVESFRPDVVMNQMTSLPKRYNPRKLRPWYKATNRLRVDGTRILLTAGARVGARRFIYQSIAFMYQNVGPLVVEEGAPVALEAPDPFGGAVRATVEGERLATTTEGIIGVALRYGQLYGPGTSSDRPSNHAPIHVDAAAYAALLAIDHGATGIYNIAQPNRYIATEKARVELGWTPDFRLPT